MTTSAATPRALRTPQTTGRAIANTLKGSLGNLVEWYDVYTYSVFQAYFKASFFPKDDPNSDIWVWAGFAVTFLARPLGAWFFGRFADRRGRRAALTLSVSVMALGSLTIALLPTREAIGMWAAAALMLLRLIQGFATGGEYASSATYMSETATARRRGFFSSFQYVTLVGGHVLAQLTLLVLQSFMGKQGLEDGGWRIPFFIGAVAAMIVLWLRSSMDETLSTGSIEAVKSGAARGAGSVIELVKHYWKPMLVCFLFTAGGTIAFYTYSISGPAIIKSTFQDADPMIANWINLGTLTFLMLLQPIGGLLSDRLGRKTVFMFFGITALVWTPIVIALLPQQTDPAMAAFLISVSYVFLTGYTSINAIFKAELFPAHVRALGVGLSYGISNSIFGGTAPMLYEWAKKADTIPVFTGLVMAAILATLITTILVMRNRAASHLDVEQGHATTIGERVDFDREDMLVRS